MAIARNTLRTNSWDVVYTYLQTTNPISTNNIYSALNSKLVNSVGYPLVIIHSPSVSFEKMTVAGNYTSSEVSMLIEVYHTSAQNVKAMADEVTAKCLAGRYVFAGNRLMNMNFDGGDYDFWQDGDKKIHRIAMNLSFRYVGE